MPYLLPRTSLLAALLVGGLAACVPAGDGRPPPPDRVYFPVGLAVSRSTDHLLIVNSDFDLQFAQGTIQSLSLERVREVSQRPCRGDAECDADEICDTAPSEQNGQQPSFVCVDENDRRPCGPFGEKAPQVRAVAVGRCAPIDLDEPADGGPSLLTDVAETSAFATQGILLQRPCGDPTTPTVCADDASAGDRVRGREGEDYPDRLFVPVRGDTAIHYVDVAEDGTLVCGRPVESQQVGSYTEARGDDPLRCSSRHRVEKGTTFGLDADGMLVETRELPLAGEEAEDELDEDDPFYDFRVQPEPIDVGATAAGRIVVVSHQVRGVVSTMMNNWVDPPSLIFVLRRLQYRPLGVTAVHSSPFPDGSYPLESDTDFLLSYRGDAQVDLLHFQDDGLLEASTTASPGSGRATHVFRPSLVQSATASIITNSSGLHSRGMLSSSLLRDQAMSACSAGDSACLDQAVQTPLDIYVTNRSPNSVLLGRTGGSEQLAKAPNLPRIFDTIPLTAGPARIVSGKILTADELEETRIFVICYDDALIYVYDPVRRRIESEIRTGRGPYAMAFDPQRYLAYVAHFTDSYIGVVSLDQTHLRTYGATLATLGIPDPPRATED